MEIKVKSEKLIPKSDESFYEKNKRRVDMKHYEVVCAIIENDEGKVFCYKRGPGRALEGFWEFPGGKVEENETHSETIIREIKEELDSVVLPVSEIGKSYYEYTNLSPYKDFSITLYGVRCKLVSGKLKLSEHTDCKWVNKRDLKDLDFAEADKLFLK